MSTAMDLATYRRLTRVTYSKDAFYPEFLKNVDEDTEVADLPALAEAVGLKVHLHVIQPSEELFAEDDALQNPPIAGIACEAQADYGDTYPNASLVGCWPLEEGEYIAIWVEPAGAA